MLGQLATNLKNADQNWSRLLGLHVREGVQEGRRRLAAKGGLRQAGQPERRAIACETRGPTWGREIKRSIVNTQTCIPGIFIVGAARKGLRAALSATLNGSRG